MLDWDFAAINHAVEDGGKGYDVFQVMLIEEQWGRATGALWDIPWRPSIPLAAGTEDAEGPVPAARLPRRAPRRVRDHARTAPARTSRWCRRPRGATATTGS